MLRLDYISCVLTILSTILIGRRVWQGWIIAGANSLLICVIGFRTAQTGFIPANLFCLGIYGYNLVQWRAQSARQVSLEPRASDVVTVHHTRSWRRSLSLMRGRTTSDEQPIRHRDRVRGRRVLR
jgi:hypothetical protein